MGQPIKLFEGHTYSFEMMILINQESAIIKIPYWNDGMYGNGDKHMILFTDTREQMRLLYNRHVVKLRVDSFSFATEYQKINLNVAKYLAEKMYRFYKLAEENSRF